MNTFLNNQVKPFYVDSEMIWIKPYMQVSCLNSYNISDIMISPITWSTIDNTFSCKTKDLDNYLVFFGEEKRSLQKIIVLGRWKINNNHITLLSPITTTGKPTNHTFTKNRDICLFCWHWVFMITAAINLISVAMIISSV